MLGQYATQGAIRPPDTFCRPDPEAAARPDGNASDVGARLFAAGHNSPDHTQYTRSCIAGLEAPYPFGLFGRGPRKAVLVHPAHLPAAPARRLDLKRAQAGRDGHGYSRLAHTGGIHPVLFLVALPSTVVLAAPA